MINLPFYIDPGTGMILIQLIIAGAASIFLGIKKIPQKIKKLFKKTKK